MKNYSHYLLLIGVTMFLNTCNTRNHTDPSALKGYYLGQKPPGMKPEIFAPDIVSTGLNEGVCTLMPEGKEIIYTVIYGKPHDHRVFTSLVMCRLNGNKLSMPELLPFSGSRFMDMYPFISHDGKTLFFQSDRPTDKTGLKDEYNIWKSERTNNEWGTPEPLPYPINGRGNVSGPSISGSGDFYFTLMDSVSSAIYRSKFKDGEFSEPERLPDNVNPLIGSFDGVISPDGSYYILGVYNKEDSFGGTDLYVTFKKDDNNWTPLINLGSTINTERNEGSAMISPDGKYLFFSGCLVSHNFYNSVVSYEDILNFSTRPQYGNPDIYWVDTKLIDELRPEN